MKLFILLVALLTPTGELQPYRTLTPPLTLAQCEELKDNRVMQISYLEDAWYGHKLPGAVVLVCAEYQAGKKQ